MSLLKNSANTLMTDEANKYDVPTDLIRKLISIGRYVN